MKVLGKRVLIAKDIIEAKTTGGIILPDAVADKKKPSTGTVKSVGREVTALQENDRVVFPEYAGTEITVDGQACLIMNETDVLGVVVDE